MKWPDCISILSLVLSGGLFVVAGIGYSNANTSNASSIAVIDSGGRAALLDTLLGTGQIGLIVVTAGEKPVPEPPVDTLSKSAPSADADTLHIDTASLGATHKPIAPAQPSSCININTANESQLITIKGIGPVLAGNIITYRNTNGPFRKIEDIRNVKGIGPAKYAQITAHICL